MTQDGGFDRTYSQLREKILQYIGAQSVDDRIRAMVLDLVNQALRAQNIVLPNPMKDAVTSDVLKSVLTEMLAEME